MKPTLEHPGDPDQVPGEGQATVPRQLPPPRMNLVNTDLWQVKFSTYGHNTFHTVEGTSVQESIGAKGLFLKNGVILTWLRDFR